MADLGPTLSAATEYGNAREAEGRAAVQAELDAVQAELAAAREEYAEHLRTAHPVERGVLMGMATDDYDLRVSETGPIDVHRVFVPSFNVGSLVNKVREANARGVVPYWSLKFGTSDSATDWNRAKSGAMDADFRALGAALADLDFPTFGSFHHEPRGGSISTPSQLVAWSEANVRAMNIVRPLAGPQHLLGTTDNGFPWSAKWGRLTDADLAIYYTPTLLAACDFLGGDFYDGATNTNPGEPAAVKMANFEAWAERVAPGKPLAVGEWNAVLPADIYAAWDVLKDGPWAAACIFNSGQNNRPDLPASLNGSWVLTGDRLAAFKDVLAQSRA